MVTLKSLINIINVFLKFSVGEARTFQSISMMHPTKAQVTLNKLLVRIVIFGANWTLSGHDWDGKVG